MAWIADAILQRQIVLLRADRRVRSRNDRCALLPADTRDTRIQQEPTVSVCVCVCVCVHRVIGVKINATRCDVSVPPAGSSYVL